MPSLPPISRDTGARGSHPRAPPRHRLPKPLPTTASSIDLRLCAGQFEQKRRQLLLVFVLGKRCLLVLQAVDLSFDVLLPREHLLFFRRDITSNLCLRPQDRKRCRQNTLPVVGFRIAYSICLGR